MILHTNTQRCAAHGQPRPRARNQSPARFQPRRGGPKGVNISSGGTKQEIKGHTETRHICTAAPTPSPTEHLFNFNLFVFSSASQKRYFLYFVSFFVSAGLCGPSTSGDSPEKDKYEIKNVPRAGSSSRCNGGVVLYGQGVIKRYLITGICALFAR